MRKEWIIEPLSLKKIEKYTNAGEEFKLISDSGKEVRILATNCGTDNDNIIVEDVNADKYGRKSNWFVSKTGKATYHDYPDVYIWRGHNDVEKGDLIKIYNSETGDFHFMAFFDGWHIENSKEIQFKEYAGMDCYGGQFDLCILGHRIDDKHRAWVEICSDEEYDKYFEFALKNGHGYSEELGRWCDVPKVGEKYWSIEMENGKPYIIEHEGPKTDEERPKDHVLCFVYKKRAEMVLKNMIEATKKVNM